MHEHKMALTIPPLPWWVRLAILFGARSTVAFVVTTNGKVMSALITTCAVRLRGYLLWRDQWAWSAMEDPPAKWIDRADATPKSAAGPYRHVAINGEEDR